MTAVMVDDEVYCTDVLQILLKKYCPDVSILAVFNHPVEALGYLKYQQPDIIFLDIEMPHMNGFDLLRQLGTLTSRVIFTTAYNQYAVKAFKFNAVDYLLKPIDKDELKSAIARTTPIIQPGHISHLQHMSTQHVPERILLPIGNEIVFVQVSDIICCEADGSYCKIYCTDLEKPYFLSKNLRDIEELLNNPNFFRPHASWLIHDKYITKIIRGEGMEIILKGQFHIPVARSKKQEVVDRWIR